jgi:enamine deaminase RidA (YjgF/YER057c/UK114 family)
MEIKLIISLISLLTSNVIAIAQKKTQLITNTNAETTTKQNKIMNENISTPDIIDIWSWHKEHAFVQGRVVSGTGKLVFCAGQTSVDENGKPIHPGDMAGQIKQALDNLEAVLTKGGAKLKDVVRMTYYVRDMNAFLEVNPILTKRYAEAGCYPTSTLIGVTALFHSDILFEVEATAVIK